MASSSILSYSDNFDNDKYYKVAGLVIYNSFDQLVINRQAYDLLTYLGDVGGLNEVLAVVGQLLIGWCSLLRANTYLKSFLFYNRSNSGSSPEK